MRKALFSTYCTTCQARIAVLSTEALGQILECPKCGSMVQVLPPEGWTAPSSDPASAGASTPVPPPGPPPLEKVGDTFLTLDLEEQTSGGSLSEWLSVGLRGRVVWICGAVGVGVMVLILWAAWAAMVAKEGADLAEKNRSHPPESTQASSTVRAPAVTPSPGKTTEQSPGEPASSKGPSAERPVEPPSTPSDHSLMVPENNPDPADPASSEPESDPPPIKTALPSPAPNELATAESAIVPALSETSAARLVRSVAPATFDSEQRLGSILPEVELKDIPLGRALALAASLSNVPLTLDPDALFLAGVSLRDPVSIRLHEATLEELFTALVAERGLGIQADNNQVLITLPAEQRENLRQVRYAVADLCPNQRALEALAAQVRALVAPKSWQENGGPATMKAAGGALLVTHCGAVHREIVIFCEKLRRARDLPLRSRLPPSRFTLTTRYAQAQPVLQRVVAGNYHEPTPLMQILDDLAAQAGVDILIDRRTLAAEGMTDQMEVSYVVDEKPLEPALEELLRPLKLGFRPAGPTTLQVTTRKALQDCRELEFYPVGKMLRDDFGASDLIEQIKNAVAPASWKGLGKAEVIYFDRASNMLIVFQSPPVQAAVWRFLAQLNENKP